MTKTAEEQSGSREKGASRSSLQEMQTMSKDDAAFAAQMFFCDDRRGFFISDEQIQKHCQPNSVRLKNSKFELPKQVQMHLAQYIIGRGCLPGERFHYDPPQDVLDDFGRLYHVFDPSKDKQAQSLALDGIQKAAAVMTAAMCAQGGVQGKELASTRGSQRHPHYVNPSIQRGYEHILDDQWDGRIEKKFGEVENIKKLCDYGFQRSQYTKTEIDDLERYFAKNIERARAYLEKSVKENPTPTPPPKCPTPPLKSPTPPLKSPTPPPKLPTPPPKLPTPPPKLPTPPPKSLPKLPPSSALTRDSEELPTPQGRDLIDKEGQRGGKDSPTVTKAQDPSLNQGQTGSSHGEKGERGGKAAPGGGPLHQDGQYDADLLKRRLIDGDFSPRHSPPKRGR